MFIKKGMKNKLKFSIIIEYYSAIKMNILLIHIKTWMHLKNNMLRERSKQKRVHTVCFHLYESLKKPKLIYGDESRLVAPRDRGRGEQLEMCTREFGGRWYLDCKNSYTSMCICQNSSNVILPMWSLLCSVLSGVEAKCFKLCV